MQERFQLNKENILSDIAPIALSSLPSSALFFLAFYVIMVSKEQAHNMKLEYENRHKKSSRKKNILIVILVLGILAVLTFVGGFLDYLFKLNIITYVMFIVAFIIAYTLFKKCIVEYKYVYADDVFTVERLIDDSEKLIFASDKKFIVDILKYEQCSSKYGNIHANNLSFSKRQDCWALVYNSEDKKKAVLIDAADEFITSLKAELELA